MNIIYSGFMKVNLGMFWAVLMYRQYRSMYPDHWQILDTFWFKWSCYYFKLQILPIAFSVNELLNFLWSVRNQMSRILMEDLHGSLNNGDFIWCLMQFAPTSLRACRGYWVYWSKWEKCPGTSPKAIFSRFTLKEDDCVAFSSLCVTVISESVGRCDSASRPLN